MKNRIVGVPRISPSNGGRRPFCSVSQYAILTCPLRALANFSHSCVCIITEWQSPATTTQKLREKIKHKKKPNKHRTTLLALFTYRLEKLAVASSATTNVDEDSIRAIEDFFLPVFRSQSYHVRTEGIGRFNRAKLEGKDQKEASGCHKWSRNDCPKESHGDTKSNNRAQSKVFPGREERIFNCLIIL